VSSLLTKYRPEKFADVVGQDAVVKSLQSVLKKDVARTFLFAGPSGVGKTTLARIVAKERGCLPADLLEIDAATYTGIDEMRSVTANLMYKPLGQGAIKAIIVDEVHDLSKQAKESLLKSLEEPPAWIFWLLCTTEPGKLPQSTITRCVRYDLKPVSPNTLADLLGYVADQEKLSTSDEIITLCAKEAQGSPRQALANLALCMAAKSRAEAADLLRSAVEHPAAIDLARSLYRGAGWGELQQIVADLNDVDAESVRQVIRAYGTKVAMGATKESQAGRALEILDAFSEPFNRQDGITPVLLAVGRLTLLSPA
jgi:DNA polymerase-3 subunit gamma/tau